MRTPSRQMVAGLAVVLLLGPTAGAQVEPAAKPAPRGPLGDTSRFTRLGGWGGVGGMVGHLGASRAMLVMMPAVQTELKLTEAQKKGLKDWEAGMRKRGEELFRPPAPPPANADAGADGQPRPDPNANGPNGFNPFAMGEIVKEMVAEGEEGLARVLNKAQRKRLDELSLQMEGVSALARPEVAEAVNLSPEQSEQIQAVLAEGRTAQMGFFVNQTIGLARARQAENGDAPPVDQAEKTAKPGKAASPRAQPDPEARAKQRQAQVAKFMDGADRIQNDTTTKLVKILTRRQRERFDKLLGTPFDPAQLEGPGQGRQGATVAGTTSPGADAKKAETPAPAKSSRLRDSRFGGDSKSKDQ